VRLLPLVVTTASLAALGCGGESADVGGIVDRHLEAIADGDSRAACRDLTAEAKKLVVVSVNATAGDDVARTCETAYDGIAAGLDDAVKEKLRDSRQDVSLDGDRAVVDSSATTGEVQLQRTGETWRITRINFGS
jgi:hypothetical protein